MLDYVLICTGCFVLSLSLIVALRFLALRFKFLVVKDVALVGGIGVSFAVMAASLWAGYVLGGDLRWISVVVGTSVLMLLFGVWDDFKEQGVAQKFLFQAICAGVLIAFGIKTHIVYFGLWGNAVVSFLWILGVTNAFNLLDIADGLSAGVAFISTAAFFIVSMVHPNLEVQIMSMVLCAALAGFWIFNFPPAKIYLGNAGSHFLGFMLSALALTISYASVERPLALISPIIMLWLPLLETAVLIYFRLKKGILPFYKSRDHIALKLVSGGFSHKGALFLMLGLALFFAWAGILMSVVDGCMSVLILLAVLLASGVMFVFLRRMASDVT
ncbi:MAG: MraY family glycosyltransferase [Candidatus Omnitrophota bacterium]